MLSCFFLSPAVWLMPHLVLFEAHWHCAPVLGFDLLREERGAGGNWPNRRLLIKPLRLLIFFWLIDRHILCLIWDSLAVLHSFLVSFLPALESDKQSYWINQLSPSTGFNGFKACSSFAVWTSVTFQVSFFCKQLNGVWEELLLLDLNCWLCPSFFFYWIIRLLVLIIGFCLEIATLTIKW